jgi:hypothetical protein
MAQGKVLIIAGDMNAKATQVAQHYDNIFEASGHHLDHVLTNQTIAKAD